MFILDCSINIVQTVLIGTSRWLMSVQFEATLRALFLAVCRRMCAIVAYSRHAMPTLWVLLIAIRLLFEDWISKL